MENSRGLNNDLLIDTNVFLSFLNKEEDQPWEKSLLLINHIAAGTIHAFVTRFALYTIAIKVTHNSRPKQLERLYYFLDNIENSQGLTVYDTSTLDQQEIVKLMKTVPLDFDDALHYFVASQLKLTLVSFDRDFDKTDLARIEPVDVLSKL
jgi:predicted nucleic acid-binding protein